MSLEDFNHYESLVIDSIIQFAQPLSTTKLTLPLCDRILLTQKWFRWNHSYKFWVELLVSENFPLENEPSGPHAIYGHNIYKPYPLMKTQVVVSLDGRIVQVWTEEQQYGVWGNSVPKTHSLLPPRDCS